MCPISLAARAMSQTVQSLQAAIIGEDKRIDQSQERLAELSIMVSSFYRRAQMVAYAF